MTTKQAFVARAGNWLTNDDTKVVVFGRADEMLVGVIGDMAVFWGDQGEYMSMPCHPFTLRSWVSPLTEEQELSHD
jgi:hypothetical protein